MRIETFQRMVVKVLALAVMSMGYIQASSAAMIGTAQVMSAQSRLDQLSRIEQVLARQDVAAQLMQLGVAPDRVMERVQFLTDDQVAELAGELDRQVAGQGLLEVVGVVFIVLLILELVGVIDIFKKT